MKTKNRVFSAIIFTVCLLAIITSCKKDNETLPIYTNEDIDGNVYDTVKIGTQIWMAQNLRTTRLNDGTLITPIIDSALWVNATSFASTTYNNTIDHDTIATYGRLYNWYTVNTGKLCPSGWHVPTEAEWTTLTNYLGGDELAGGKLKESGTLHWNDPNVGADNSSDFTALPAGVRAANGNFYNMGDNAYFWSQSKAYYINRNAASLNNFDVSKNFGYSIRCIKD